MARQRPPIAIPIHRRERARPATGLHSLALLTFRPPSGGGVWRDRARVLASLSRRPPCARAPGKEREREWRWLQLPASPEKRGRRSRSLTGLPGRVTSRARGLGERREEAPSEARRDRGCEPRAKALSHSCIASTASKTHAQCASCPAMPNESAGQAGCAQVRSTQWAEGRGRGRTGRGCAGRRGKRRTHSAARAKSKPISMCRKLN